MPSATISHNQSEWKQYVVQDLTTGLYLAKGPIGSFTEGNENILVFEGYPHGYRIPGKYEVVRYS